MASTVFQSTKINLKVLDSIIFWGSLHFVDQNKNLAKSKITMPTIGVHLSEHIRYYRLGLQKLT